MSVKFNLQKHIWGGSFMGCSTLLRDLLDSLGSQCCSAYAATANKGEAMMGKLREASEHKQPTLQRLHTLSGTGFFLHACGERAACRGLSVMQIPPSPLTNHLLVDEGQAWKVNSQF